MEGQDIAQEGQLYTDTFIRDDPRPSSFNNFHEPVLGKSQHRPEQHQTQETQRHIHAL